MFTYEHVGRIVYDSVHYGRGVITNFKKSEEYPVTVKFDNGTHITYTEEGRINKSIQYPTLSFTPYTFQGYINTPPQTLPKVGETILVSKDKEDWRIRVFDGVANNGKFITTNGTHWNYYKRYKELE